MITEDGEDEDSESLEDRQAALLVTLAQLITVYRRDPSEVPLSVVGEGLAEMFVIRGFESVLLEGEALLAIESEIDEEEGDDEPDLSDLEDDFGEPVD